MKLGSSVDRGSLGYREIGERARLKANPSSPPESPPSPARAVPFKVAQTPGMARNNAGMIRLHCLAIEQLGELLGHDLRAKNAAALAKIAEAMEELTYE